MGDEIPKGKSLTLDILDKAYDKTVKTNSKQNRRFAFASMRATEYISQLKRKLNKRNLICRKNS